MKKFLQVYVIVLLLVVGFLKLDAKTGYYRLVIRDNPSSSMCIAWNQFSGSEPQVYYDTEDHGQNWKDYKQIKSPDRVVFYKGMNNHFARLVDLKPSTKYFFVIKDSEGTCKRLWFETLPDNPKIPLSIVMGGDSRRSKIAGNKSWEPRVKTNQMIQKIKPHFIAFGGDFTLTDSDKQWKAWFEDWQHTIDSSGRVTPIVPARGNHERDNNSIFHLFDVPSPDVTYALTFGTTLLRFYVLNSLNPVVKSKQTEWLKSDLEKNKGQQTWRMVQYHYPILPHQASKKPRPEQYEHWAPLFYKYRVRLAVECDAHVVKQTEAIKPDEKGDAGFLTDSQNGTVFLGEGTWGLIREANVSYNWTRALGSFYQFKWVILDQNIALVRTVHTQNPHEVESVDLKNRLKIPQGMKLWEIDGKNEIEITP